MSQSDLQRALKKSAMTPPSPSLPERKNISQTTGNPPDFLSCEFWISVICMLKVNSLVNGGGVWALE